MLQFQGETAEIKYVEYNDTTEKTVLNFELMIPLLLIKGTIVIKFQIFE